MKFLNNRKSVPVYLAIIIVLLVLMNSCAATRITGGQRAVVISAERYGYNSNYAVCLELEDGRRFTFKYNVHCYPPCVADIPTVWDVTEYANKSLSAEPVK